MSALLEVREVSKSFGGVQAVNRVSLDVNDGDLLSVIGPNGAGKTTLLNMEAFGGSLFDQGTVLNLIPALRLIVFGGLIIGFLIVEPEGLNRLWRNIRSYFRVWPFAY